MAPLICGAGSASSRSLDLVVTEADIENAVLEHSVRTFEQLQSRTKISTGCGQCRDEAERTLNQILDNFKIAR